MLTTTSEYKTEISKTGRHFLNKIIINETEYTGIKNFSYHGGTNSSDHISIGDAVSAYIEFTLTDCPSKMLTGQKATAYIGLKLSDSVEWIKMGIFHLDKPKRNGNYLDITAYDNFSLMEKGFYSDLSGNQKIVDILDEQCNKIGISFVGGADDVYYDVDLLKGSTVREAVAILAAYCGKNAIINRDGNLKFVWFDDIGVTLTDDYYNDTIEFDEEDTVIKRLDCTNETETLSIGTGIGIVFSCPGMTQERLNVLYNRINGFTYRAVSFDWQRARPDIEAGDMINLTIQGNNCSVPLMDFIVSCDGGCYGSIESKGKTQEEQDHEFTSPSEARYNFVYEEVISVKKVMADTIDAWQGNFESIETNFLTVNQKITALEGEFEKINVDELTARIATIEQAYISKVEAAELYATKAEIGVLDADVSNIKTLLAGSTTTGDLQSIVINSKNAIIENGTIKNAMIENLAFDKITGVDINTTKLTVHSADGKSKWQDNTIQISDSTRVRVQIGKDASNDYNIYIWDKTGKLMFDVTGVTADGIQRPIIRDDMVSDTANINGKKINIQSVVTEINNGTEKIKSSTVLYDPTGQTLNIAFNELVTTVDGIDKRVESNTTQISVANGEISTLISKTMQMQTDLSSAQGNITDLSTKYNQMKQTVDSYGVTIGEHTSQITNIENNVEDTIKELTEVSDKQSSMQIDLDGFKTSVSNTYATKTQLNTVDGKFANYSTTTQMNTAINQSASNIKLEASKTYATKNELTGKVDTDKVVSAINVSPESIKIQSSKITLEGIVTANSRFKILADGSMESVNGKFTGVITATSGKIAGFIIDNTFIQKADKSVGFGVDPQWAFWAGGNTAETAKFRVTAAGLVYAKYIEALGGKIGKFNINGNYLMAGSGSTAAGLTGDQAFWAGGELSNVAPFRVSYDGKLVATNATITGAITGGTTINITRDATIGNNLYVGQDQSVGSSIMKYLFFSNKTYIRKFRSGSSNESMLLTAPENIALRAGYDKAMFAGITVSAITNPSLQIGTYFSNPTGQYTHIDMSYADININAQNAIRLYNDDFVGISYWGKLSGYGGCFTPYSTDNKDKVLLGTSSYRWHRLYAANGCDTSSDIRLKTNIKGYDVRYEKMYMELKPVTYELKSDLGKRQCGLIAQWVEEAIKNNGIDEYEFGALNINHKEDVYGLIYEQFTSLNMHMIQKTIKRVDSHDHEVTKLKSEIMQLQSKLNALIDGTLETKRV